MFADDVQLVGAGRWARVILQILCQRLPRSAQVTVVSRGHADVVREWLPTKSLEGRVTVSESLRASKGSRPAAIVANAAADHARAATSAIELGLPTLVEKPFTTSAAATRSLIKEATERRVLLAAAHVYLFAEYLVRFADVVRTLGPLESIALRWADGRAEERYGEKKRFDSSVPVYLDVFPHILSILRTVFPHCEVSFVSLSVSESGEAVNAYLMVNGAGCTAYIARNAEQRVRLLEVKGALDSASLEFAVEPGTVARRGSRDSADPGWSARPGPLSLLLDSFLSAASGSTCDPRLGTAMALDSNMLVNRMNEASSRAQ